MTSPRLEPDVRLTELAALLALGQDGAFGQPLESQLRSCLLSTWLCQALDADPATTETAYFAALLRYVGCTAHAHEVASLFGDEIALRARTLVQDAANPLAVLGDAISQVLMNRTGQDRVVALFSLLSGGRALVARNFATGCEVADVLVTRLCLGDSVRASLHCSFERWNGAGYPNGVRGEAIPLPMRVVHLAHDMEAIARIQSPELAIAAAHGRRGRTYDPQLVDAFLKVADELFARLVDCDPWQAVLALEPAPGRRLSGAGLDEALTVVADFVDLKSPSMMGHSRAVARLSERAAKRLGLDQETRRDLQRAALLHDLGTTGIPNSVWDKPGALTRSERDRVETHSLLTAQMLRRVPGLASLLPLAAAHHERLDGSGYHQSLQEARQPLAARILAAADVYAALTAPRAFREAFSEAAAAETIRAMAQDGKLDIEAVEAVLAAAGHRRVESERTQPVQLTAREVEVLRLAAMGHTTKEIAAKLFISPKTADRHIQNVYGKIGVSTRGAASLWAMQRGLIG